MKGYIELDNHYVPWLLWVPLCRCLRIGSSL